MVSPIVLAACGCILKAHAVRRNEVHEFLRRMRDHAVRVLDPLHAQRPDRLHLHTPREARCLP